MGDPHPRKKAPSYQWYPGDFRRDTALQSCSFSAKALWREMLDLMHDGEPYGHFTAGGIPITPTELARIVGVPQPKVRRWMAELEDRKVFSVTADGVIYSRRMVRDDAVRRKRAAGGSKGGNPALLKDKRKGGGEVNGKVNLPPNLRPTPASASADAIEESSLSGAKEKSSRWTVVPDSWQPNDGHWQRATDLGLDLPAELALFRAHEFKRPKSDPDRAFSAWMVQAARFAKENGARQQRQRTSGERTTPQSYTYQPTTKFEGFNR